MVSMWCMKEKHQRVLEGGREVRLGLETRGLGRREEEKETKKSKQINKRLRRRWRPPK